MRDGQRSDCESEKEQQRSLDTDKQKIRVRIRRRNAKNGCLELLNPEREVRGSDEQMQQMAKSTKQTQGY